MGRGSDGKRKYLEKIVIQRPWEIRDIPAGFAGQVIIDCGTEKHPVRVSMQPDPLYIIRRGAYADLRGSGRARVEGGHVKALGRNLRMTACADSHVQVGGKHVHVTAADNAVVFASGETHVFAAGESKVELRDQAVCKAKNHAIVRIKGHGRCVIDDEVQIYPEDDASWRHKSWKANVRGNPFRIEDEEEDEK